MQTSLSRTKHYSTAHRPNLQLQHSPSTQSAAMNSNFDPNSYSTPGGCKRLAAKLKQLEADPSKQECTRIIRAIHTQLLDSIISVEKKRTGTSMIKSKFSQTTAKRWRRIDTTIQGEKRYRPRISSIQKKLPGRKPQRRGCCTITQLIA